MINAKLTALSTPDFCPNSWSMRSCDVLCLSWGHVRHRRHGFDNVNQMIELHCCVEVRHNVLTSLLTHDFALRRSLQRSSDHRSGECLGVTRRNYPTQFWAAHHFRNPANGRSHRAAFARQIMGKKAREHVMANFNATVQFNHLVDVIESMAP